MFNGSSTKPVEIDQPDRRIEEDDIGDSEKRAMRSLRTNMACPQIIPVPEVIPTYFEDEAGIIFPKHGYEHSYFEGWNECLRVIGSTNRDVHDIEMTSSNQSFKNVWWVGAGLVAGFFDCQRRIIAPSRLYNIEQVRQSAKELFRQIPNGVYWKPSSR
jgi:hypothetical protein